MNPVIKWSVAFKESLKGITHMESLLCAAKAVDGKHLCCFNEKIEGFHTLFLSHRLHIGARVCC